MARVVSVSSNEEGYLFVSESGSRQVASEVVQRSSVLQDSLLSAVNSGEFALPVPKNETDVWLEARSILTEPSETDRLRHFQSIQLACYIQVQLRCTLFSGNIIFLPSLGVLSL